jgi:hypothetical protein
MYVVAVRAGLVVRGFVLNVPICKNRTKLEEFPLAHFAALFWHHHYKNAAGTIATRPSDLEDIPVTPRLLLHLGETS